MAPASQRQYRLVTGRYEALAELAFYYNEKTEEYEMPDAIDGKSVHGVDDDYVIGGELGCFEDEEVVEFDRVDEPQVAEWLAGSGWSALPTLNGVGCKLIALQPSGR